MCGFGLILRIGGGEIPGAWLDRLDEAIRLRGPDGSGRFRDAVPAGGGGPAMAVAMVHRRLAVIDPGGGHQPMVHRGLRGGTGPAAGDDDLVAVVFNGYIANHRDVRRALEADGVRFASDHADTEVLAPLIARHGAAAGEHLEGMYAAAAWDRTQRRVVLLRDWFGEKPLWVARRRRGDERLLVAGSHAAAVAEIAAAFEAERPGSRPCDDAWPEHAWSPPAVRMAEGLESSAANGPGRDGGDSGDSAADAPPEWLVRYLALGYTHPIAPGGVQAVPPSLPPDRIAAAARNGASEAGIPSPADIDAAIGAAVSRRLEADVPLGCFLSGGIDSTLVAAHARRRLGRLDTFTVRMPDPRHDESGPAADAARAIGTTHHTLDCTADAAADLEALIAAAGVPFADSSLLPAAWVSRAARSMVTACLGGDGGDELFGGYARYRGAGLLAGAAPLLSRLPAAMADDPRDHPRGRRRRVGRLGAMARDWPTDGILAMERIMPGTAGDALLGRAAAGPDAAAAAAPWPVHHPPARRAGAVLRALDLGSYLPGDLMTKMDTASMAHGLEVRSPMLDRSVVDVAVRCRAVGGRRTKAMLRSLARPMLGAAADRPKQGFAIPVDDWFRSDHGGLATRLGDALTGAAPFGGLPIGVPVARTMLDRHRRREADLGAPLFALLALALWAERWPGLAAG